MKVVCIKDSVSGLVKGRLYEIRGADYVRNTVTLNNNFNTDRIYKFDEEVIIVETDSKSVGINLGGPTNMYLSFLQSVEECGGSPRSISSSLHNEIRQICNVLGPNDVRFVCTKNNKVTPIEPTCNISEHSDL